MSQLLIYTVLVIFGTQLIQYKLSKQAVSSMFFRIHPKNQLKISIRMKDHLDVSFF